MAKKYEEVLDWVKFKHNELNQTRVNGDPYWTHVVKVSNLVLKYFPDASEDVVNAAIAHDIFEDTNTTLEQLHVFLGETSAIYVIEVSNVYNKEDYPLFNRNIRKNLEAGRLGGISYWAKVIKMADMMDNFSDIRETKPHMVELYKSEKLNVLSNMVSDDPNIKNLDIYKDLIELINK